MKRYPFITLFALMGLLLALVPGVPTTAAPSRTRISRIKTDYFGGQVDDPSTASPAKPHPAHPLFSTADAENVEFVGHIGGATYAVAVQGNYAYIGVGPRLVILDISNPASPTVVGKTPPLSDIVQDIAIAGSYAYIADGDAGLRVVDVSTPANPTEVGFYDTPRVAMGVTCAGGYAYVVGGGLQVVDVSTPANPTEVGFCDAGGSAVAVAGDYAYVVNGGGLQVVDVSDPAHPTEVGSCDALFANDVAVAGSYAYIAAGFVDVGFSYCALYVLDVSVPANPTEVGSYYFLAPYAKEVDVIGDYAYVASDTGGLRIVDISTPTNPAEVGSYATPGSANGVALAGDYAYVANSMGGLRIVDISMPNSPVEVGFYDLLGQAGEQAEDVAVDRRYAYVAAGEAGLRMVDISTPTDPREVSFYDTPAYAKGVAFAGNYVYVANGSSDVPMGPSLTGDFGLEVVDVSVPTNPTEVGFYDTPEWADGVAIAEGYAYIAAGIIVPGESYGILRVVDVSTPASPTEVGSCEIPIKGEDVAVDGRYAYVVAKFSGLRVVDVSTPSNPAEVGFYETPGRACGVAVAGDYAYIVGNTGYPEYDGWLQVVDISGPANPAEVGFYDALGMALGVAVANGHAYIADGDSGLRVVDVSDPTAPTEVGFYDTPGDAYGVAVAGGYIHVADGSGGLFILYYGESRAVTEARVDIGMPYSVYRGCPSPYVGCGGPHHGFYYGVCTDLAMDAYNAGASFNLQNALLQDHPAHPGRYRYGSVRYPEDMRRYFHHNQQWLPHSQAYQPGDVAFFDWDADGLSDHVGVVSEIDADGRPLRMVHAPGVCEVNPGGQAFEQDWNSHYDQHIQGHGRLSETGALTTSADETLQLLRITIDSPSVALCLRDANGKSTSDTYDENLVASGIEASIPYIPGGSYADLGTEQVITVTQPLSNTSQYFVELTGEAAATYHLRIETVQGASVTDSEVFTQTIAAGETHGGAITLSAPGGAIQFSTTSPAPAPLPGIPESLELAGLVGTSAQGTFTITETGGQQALQNVALSATEMMDSLGGTVSGSLLVISPDDFTVPAGDGQQVDVQVDLVGVTPGVYRGALMIRSDNAGTRMIPLTLNVQFHQVYLPTVLKSY